MGTEVSSLDTVHTQRTRGARKGRRGHAANRTWGAASVDADREARRLEVQMHIDGMPLRSEPLGRDRHGRTQTRVLYSNDEGLTVCCAEKVGSDKAKSFPVKEITDIKEAADEDYFELIHPKRTLAIGCGTKAARDLMVKRLRGLVMMAAQEGLPSMSDDIGSKAGAAS